VCFCSKLGPGLSTPYVMIRATAHKGHISSYHRVAFMYRFNSTMLLSWTEFLKVMVNTSTIINKNGNRSSPQLTQTNIMTYGNRQHNNQKKKNKRTNKSLKKPKG
jgi:hypothetical protein